MEPWSIKNDHIHRVTKVNKSLELEAHHSKKKNILKDFRDKKTSFGILLSKFLKINSVFQGHIVKKSIRKWPMELGHLPIKLGKQSP